MEKKRNPVILAIGGGKGGVGKSMVSSNLALHYAAAGFHVALLDLDFGAANLHTIFGLRQPAKGLGDYFLSNKDLLSEYIIETKIPRLKLVPGSGFIPELANIKYAQKLKLIQEIKHLDADLVLLDLGAGSSSNVIDFFTMTHAGVIVTTPEPTAIINAYEFLKNAIYRVLSRMFRDHQVINQLLQQSIDPKNPLNIATIADLTKAIAQIDPWAAENIREVCEDLCLHVVFNQSRQLSDVQLGLKLYEIVQKHLGIELNYAGVIFHNQEVSDAVFKMCPISVHNPDSITAHTLKRISVSIVQSLCRKMKQPELKAVPFAEQLRKVTRAAEGDYEKNLLTQRRLMQEQIKSAGFIERAESFC
ncbi:MAG: Cobyrinic acid ac-diamide synthase [Chlamydiales bacterium]|jgi:flagellar biosynthesis protein FlhG|nr:Cobyrinic acid ac-diamide synthase [Chlamydiales bacterium]